MLRSVASLALTCMLLGTGPPVTYEAYAVRFGILPAFPVTHDPPVFERFPAAGEGNVWIK